MHGLEVCRGHVRVSLRCLKVGMSHDLLQQEDIPAPAQVAGCECVPRGVERAPWCGESEGQAKPLHVAEHVAAVERSFRRCRKEQRFRLAVEV